MIDILVSILILPFTPFIYIYNWFLNKKIEKVCSKETAFNISLNILKNNATEYGILASPNEYTDVWTRDAFFAIMGLDSIGMTTAKDATLLTLRKFQREDGLIPLYVGTGQACAKLICRAQPTGPIHATYGDSKTGDVVTDSCFQYIIMMGDSPSSRKAWNYMQQYVKSGLIFETGLGSWMDTVYHKGFVLYTNVLYYKAAETLGYDTEYIKKRLYEEFWNGSYFKCSSSIDSFDQVGNALAIKWIVSDATSIIEHRRKYFVYGLTNPPCIPNVKTIYYPCYMIGNQKYHNFGWTWVNLLFLSVMKDTGELKLFEKEIQERGTVYEIYEEYGPVNQLFCRSQPDFSEAAGMYLLCSNKTVTLSI